MESEEKVISNNWEKFKKVSTYIGIPIVSLFVILIVVSFGVTQFYQNKMLPGIIIGTIDVSNLSQEEARDELVNELQQWDDGADFFVQAQGETIAAVTVPKSYVSSDDNLQYDLYSYDIDGMIRNAYNIGRSYNVFVNVRNLLQGIFADKIINFEYSIQPSQIEKYITGNLQEQKVIMDAQKAELRVQMNNNSNYIATIQDHEDGKKVDLVKGILKLEQNLQNNNYEDHIIEQETVPALITTDLVKTLEEQIPQAIQRGAIVLHNGDISWEVQPNIYGNWLTSLYDNGSLRLAFNPELVSEHLEKYISPAILREPVNAQFEIGEDGKVKTFNASRAGEVLLIDETIEELNSKFFDENDLNISLQVENTKPEIATDQANDLGIKEIIGIGRSNFAGSPANRRHNIAVGTAAVNGTVIPPGGEFSLLKVLGRIDGTTGYKEELVIKGNKTIPEYGGGLCQVGTTTFRGALDAGLDITERRNHSYRVSYYEPAGTDATIYDPAPDFKFKNDTSTHVMILTKIVGNELVWEYWGTDDGRKSEVGEPRIYNIIEPPPTKLVETEELAPGEKKCTERAHNGATADLTRVVTFADGTQKEETWHSVYRPWQEVCLVGKEPDAEPEESEGEIAEESTELLEESGIHIPQEPAQ